MPHPSSPRKNGKDLPFDYGKGIQEKVLSYFDNEKKKAIQEEDVCRVKLLCKPSVDSHPHTGNSLETIPTRCFLL